MNQKIETPREAKAQMIITGAVAIGSLAAVGATLCFKIYGRMELGWANLAIVGANVVIGIFAQMIVRQERSR